MQNKNKTERENDETNWLHTRKTARALPLSQSAHYFFFFCANEQKKEHLLSILIYTNNNSHFLDWHLLLALLTIRLLLLWSAQFNGIQYELKRCVSVLSMCLYLVYQSRTLCLYCQYTCRAELQKNFC